MARRKSYPPKEELLKMASKGGKTTVKKHGKNYMRELARKRWRQQMGGGELTARYFIGAIRKGYYIPVVPDAQIEDWLRRFPRSSYVRESVAIEVFREHPELQGIQKHNKQAYESNNTQSGEGETEKSD